MKALLEKAFLNIFHLMNYEKVEMSFNPSAHILTPFENNREPRQNSPLRFILSYSERCTGHESPLEPFYQSWSLFNRLMRWLAATPTGTSKAFLKYFFTQCLTLTKPSAQSLVA
mmetsp:Transcript_56904/g.64931  ORF Transcript_56904/g.64931 Transcript_56904/m.64931 type:complete len:114 (-) Transcript_56904:121-462(-)